MLTMPEALARERMRDAERNARQARLARHLVAARRWGRLERMARATREKHDGRAVATVEALEVSRSS
jgi:hypothetical protein